MSLLLFCFLSLITVISSEKPGWVNKLADRLKAGNYVEKCRKFAKELNTTGRQLIDNKWKGVVNATKQRREDLSTNVKKWIPVVLTGVFLLLLKNVGVGPFPVLDNLFPVFLICALFVVMLILMMLSLHCYRKREKEK